MAPLTMLRSLRVSAELDAASYVAGSKQKIAADEAMVASSRAFGASLADVDSSLDRLPAGMARLSRMWVDGYSQAEKFQKGLYQIDKSLGEGMDSARAVVMLTALEKSMGRNVTQSDLMRQKLSALVPILGEVQNASAAAQLKLEAMAEVQSRRVAGIAGNSIRNSLDSNLGIKDDFDTLGRGQDVAKAYGDEIERLSLKYDHAETAAKQYKATLLELDRAFGLGAVSERIFNEEKAKAQSLYQGFGASQGSGGQSPATKSARESALVFEEAAAAQDRMASSAKMLLAELYPEQAALTALTAHLQEYNVMLSQGLISQDAHTAAGDRAQKNYNYIAENAAKAGKGMRLSRFEMQNLSYQLNDIAVMTASGQAPFVMLMQQGMQIAQIIGPQGLAGGMKSLGVSILSFVTNPTNLTVLAFAALAAGAVYAYQQMGSGLPKIEDMLKSQKTILDDLSKSYAEIGLKVAGISGPNQKVISLEARLNIEQSKKRITQDLEELLKGNTPVEIRTPHGTGYLNKEYLPFSSALKELNKEIKDGAPDFDRFREAIAKIGSDPSATEEMKKLALSMRDGIKPTEDMWRQTEQLSASLDKLKGKSDLFGQDLGSLLGSEDTLKSLRSFTQDFTSTRDQIERSYQAAKTQADYSGDINSSVLADDLRAKALAQVNAETQKSIQLNALDLQAIYAKSPAQKAAIAAERERVNAINTAIQGQELDIKVQQASAMAYQQATYAITEQNHARMVSANDNVRQAQLEIQLVGASAEQRAFATANLSSYLDLQKQAYSTGTGFDEAQFAELKKSNAERAVAIGLLEKINIQRDLNNQLKYASMLPGDQKVSQFNDGKFIKEGTAAWIENAASIRAASIASLQLQIDNEKLYAGMSPHEADIAKQLDNAGIKRYSAAWDNLAAQIRAAQEETQTFGYGAKTAFQTLQDDANNYAQTSSLMVNDMYSGLQDVWMEFAKTGKLSFSSLIDTMIADLQKLAYQVAMSGLLNAINPGSAPTNGGLGSVISSLMGAFFGGGAGSTQTDLHSANGNAFDNNGVTAFAKGGVVTRPTAFGYGAGQRGLMGEAGPESIMPLARTSSGKLGVHVASNDNGGNNQTNVIVNNFGNSRVEVSQDSQGTPTIDIDKMLNSKLEGEYGLKKVQNRRV
jgi:phage-related minor tail protein